MDTYAPNLADPSVEPTDEQFRELLRRAAGDARAGHEAAERALRERVRAERALLLAELERRKEPAR
jgi:hypothetical protein